MRRRRFRSRRRGFISRRSRRSRRSRKLNSYRVSRGGIRM